MVCIFRVGMRGMIWERNKVIVKGAFGHPDYSITAVNKTGFCCIINGHYELAAIIRPLSCQPNAPLVPGC